MKQFPMLKKAALAFAAAGLLASASAHADTLLLDQDINTLMAFNVDVGGTNLAVDSGVFNVANLTAGNSFVAFCYELLQGVSVDAVTTGLDFTAGASVPVATQTLYNQSFGQVVLTNAVDVAAFQIALWETLDDGDLTTGNLSNWAGTTGSAQEDEALITAWTFLEALRNGDPATGNYNLTTWVNGISQDLISAGTSAVPEPATLALGAIGLAGMSIVRRRKS